MGVGFHHYRNISNGLPDNACRNNRYSDSETLPAVSFCLDFRYDMRIIKQHHPNAPPLSTGRFAA
jgi:hypothetical protein